MRLISFEKDGAERFGAVVAEGVVDLTGRVEGARTLRELLAKAGLAGARDYCGTAKPACRFEDSAHGSPARRSVPRNRLPLVAGSPLWRRSDTACPEILSHFTPGLANS